MKIKRLFLVPALLLIISIVTSIIAFQNTKKLEAGYLYFSESQGTAAYDGEYFAIIGNLKDTDYYIRVESTVDFIYISTLDQSENIMKDFTITIAKQNQTYDSSIITNVLTTTPVIIDNLDDYIFTVSLDANTIYDLNVTQTSENNDPEFMDLILVNLPEQFVNMKSLNESVAFSSFIFSILSFGTILAIYYIKKD